MLGIINTLEDIEAAGCLTQHRELGFNPQNFGRIRPSLVELT